MTYDRQQRHKSKNEHVTTSYKPTSMKRIVCIKNGRINVQNRACSFKAILTIKKYRASKTNTIHDLYLIYDLYLPVSNCHILYLFAF